MRHEANSATTVISATVRSLVWQGETLVDWAGGGQVLRMDGTVQARPVNYAYPFDAAVASPSGRFAVIYVRTGTKGLLLDRGQVVRELNRSFYFANAYEYPIAMLQLPDGREAVAHCPNRYNELVLEDAATGELIIPPQPDCVDFFHSRLAVSPTGRWLISAGWAWSPFSAVKVFDVEACLRTPTLFNAKQNFLPGAEQSLAAFLDDQTLVCHCEAGGTDPDEGEDITDRPLGLLPKTIGRFDLPTRRFTSVAPLEENAGLMMPMGDRHVIGFFEHPKLIDLDTGRIVQRWPELATGRQICSITWGKDGTPPLALDPVNRRFALGMGQQVHVVTVHP